MTDEMRWSPNPPRERPVPLLRIDLTGFAAEMAAARPYVESVVGSYAATVRDAYERAVTAAGLDTPNGLDLTCSRSTYEDLR